MYKAYFIMREDLELPPSKLAVQVGHGTDLIWEGRYRDPKAFESWLDKDSGDRRKIILKAKTKEQLDNIRNHVQSEGIYCCDIVDSGYTIVEPGTITGLVVFPTDTSSKKINRLRTY